MRGYRFLCLMADWRGAGSCSGLWERPGQNEWLCIRDRAMGHWGEFATAGGLREHR
jgi:hypothetical protein